MVSRMLRSGDSLRFTHERSEASGTTRVLLNTRLPPAARKDRWELGGHRGCSQKRSLSSARGGMAWLTCLALWLVAVLGGVSPIGRAAGARGGVTRLHRVVTACGSPEISALRTNNSQAPGLPSGVTLYVGGRPLGSSRPRKKPRRSREDLRREQKALLDKTASEIDAIAAEFHAKLPREKAQTIGAMYARYSSRFQDSIADQVRTVFEAAYAQGIFIPREHVFFDMAVRGWKDRRPGLTALRQVIRQKAIQVFLVFSTSRLFRRTYKAMQFVEEEIVDRGIRGIFLKSNLDTANGENWRTMFQLLAAMDEAMVRMYGSHVQAAHEGLFIRQMVCTSLPLGYTGEEVPGELTKRQRPRRRIVIDAEARPWIERIFQWYVGDSKSLDQIARELNDAPDAPVPNKSFTGLWTHGLVRKVLLNPAYRGCWSYGSKQTKWSSERDYSLQVPREKPLKTSQFEDLRIISDELWYRAQRLLAGERSKSGRSPKDGQRKWQPQLLRGLFICPEHGRQLVAGGRRGQILFCPLCRSIKAAERPVFTNLRRSLALRLTCQALAELVRADEELGTRIIAACQREAESVQQSDPELPKRLRQQAAKLLSTIEFNRRNPGETDEEQRQTQQLLKDLRRQHTEIQAQLADCEAASKAATAVPTPEEITGLLSELGDMLTAAASADTEQEMRAARRIIDELTCGRIEVFQMGERKRGGGWLQGRFTVDVVAVAAGRLAGLQLPKDETSGRQVVIDYRAPRAIDELAEQAKRLWDEKLLHRQIAERMGSPSSYVTKLIHHWFDSRGLPRPDGRGRRASLPGKQTETPRYQTLAGEACELAEQGMSLLSIAKRFKTSDSTVSKAIAWSFTSRGLPVPTAEDWRRKMLQRAKSQYDSGKLIKDIAADLGYSARGLKLALAAYFVELGEPMPDGRSRRGKLGVSELKQSQSHGTEYPPTDRT
ncbi:MAG: recombinase family protein [Pirellulales bacterium]